MKYYKLHAKALKNTIAIAEEFANVCEEVRPQDEVWNIGVYGIRQIGKSRFTNAFANAGMRGAAALDPEDPAKMRDLTDETGRKQIRCGDYAVGQNISKDPEASFIKPRQEGFGGYDTLEHAPGNYPHIAKVIFAYATKGRDIVMHVEEELADTPAFQQFTQKFDAKELDLS